MNLKEIALDEMELHTSLLEEGISCLLHTTLFVRSPGSVRPADVHCKKIAPLTYAKCGNDHVENSVTEAIVQFKKSLVQVGPGLSRGVVILSFFEKRENKGFFGMLTTQEKVYFERWRIPILVNENQLESTSDVRGGGGSSQQAASSREYRHRVYETAREEIKQRMLCIFENANSSVDHVPATAYEFEIISWMIDS
mmetsp:Transcript_5522/g.9080  ORF Transcript_5522/g.9080 Transcript_5522/m.9080 type:complete len:196 (-) Transcript_5522:252-839(-)